MRSKTSGFLKNRQSWAKISLRFRAQKERGVKILLSADGSTSVGTHCLLRLCEILPRKLKLYHFGRKFPFQNKITTKKQCPGIVLLFIGLFSILENGHCNGPLK